MNGDLSISFSLLKPGAVVQYTEVIIGYIKWLIQNHYITLSSQFLKYLPISSEVLSILSSITKVSVEHASRNQSVSRHNFLLTLAVGSIF